MYQRRSCLQISQFFNKKNFAVLLTIVELIFFSQFGSFSFFSKVFIRVNDSVKFAEVFCGLVDSAVPKLQRTWKNLFCQLDEGPLRSLLLAQAIVISPHSAFFVIPIRLQLSKFPRFLQKEARVY